MQCVRQFIGVIVENAIKCGDWKKVGKLNSEMEI